MKRKGMMAWAIAGVTLMSLPAITTNGDDKPPATQASTQVSTQASATQPAAHLIKAPTKPDEYLTPEQLVQAYRESQFPLVIRESGRILSNPKVASAYNTFNVLVLRGESFLQSKNFPLAIETFDAAAKAAPDLDRRAVMTATKTMIEKRNGSRYHSWTTDDRGAPLYPPGVTGKQPIPIDIMDLSKREAVFRALCWDQAAQTQKNIAAIAHNNKLALVNETMDLLDKLSVLENAGRGGQEQTDKFRKDLVVAIEAGLSKRLAWQRTRMVVINNAAQELETTRLPPPDARVIVTQPVSPHARPPAQPPNNPPDNATGETEIAQPHGLGVPEVKELEAIMDVAGKVPASIDAVVQRLNVDAKVFAQVLKQAAVNKEAAVGLLEGYKHAGLLK
jgi:hypothetical protein